MLQLTAATVMVLLTVVIHLVGLAGLLWPLRAAFNHPDQHSLPRQLLTILGVSLGLFAIHTIEIWLYALLYVALNATHDFEAALYFSTVTYATIGYGDLTLAKDWRLLGAIEGANGVILLGWSTAFFLSIVDRLRIVERKIGR